jgi:hypothetical protein
MNDNEDTTLDRATADRLARLGAMPVDVSRLERALEREVGPRVRRRRASPAMRWMRAAAALLLIAIGVGVAVSLTGGGPVMASAAQMAQMHEDLVSGRLTSVKVGSIEEAADVLTKQWGGSVPIPDLPDEHVRACCSKSVKDKKVACILLEAEGLPVTMTVSKASEMKVGGGKRISRGGATYFVDRVGELTMIMTERDGRWICLIGKLGTDRLIDLASGLTF